MEDRTFMASSTKNENPISAADIEQMIETPILKEGPWIAGTLVARETSLRKSLYKVKDEAEKQASSRKSSNEQKVWHPFNMDLVDSMVEVNPYHGSCQATLVSATVGAGFGIIDVEKTKAARLQAETMDVADAAGMLPVINHDATAEAYDILDDMCEHDFDSTLLQLAANYWGLGTAYLEVARDSNDLIDAIYWTPAQDVHRLLYGKGDRNKYAFSTTGPDGETYYAKWRGVDGLRASDVLNASNKQDNLNELIDFLRPTTRWEGYGAPHWLAAVPYMDVDVRSLQRVSDYMFNNAMPSSVIMLGGISLGPEQVEKMRQVLSGASGSSSGQGALLTFPSSTKDNAWVEHIKLSDSVEGSGFESLHSTINLSVASANQVPPILAGITTPGKMGAANEGVQAIMTLQSNTISPVQRYLAKRLNRTLFAKTGGVRGLGGKKIRMMTWIEQMDMAALNTVARQREQVAVNPKRDPKDGLKRSLSGD